MTGGVTRHMLPRLTGVSQLHVNRPLKFIHTLDSSHLKFGACQKWEQAGRYKWCWKFLNVFAESPFTLYTI